MAAWQAILHAHDNSFCNLIWQVHKRRVKTIVDIHGLCAVKSYEIMKSCSECAILAHVHTGIICLVLSDMYTITKHAYSLELSRHIHILSHDLRQILWYIHILKLIVIVASSILKLLSMHTISDSSWSLQVLLAWRPNVMCCSWLLFQITHKKCMYMCIYIYIYITHHILHVVGV